MDAFANLPSLGHEQPSYEILGVVGRGGYGTVYRARMRTSSGFVKDVAIKLLHEEATQTSELTRFRDEARILGLLRDPAVVSVEPPTRLEGRWAVIMDYVDGYSCAEILHQGQPFPPVVAVEIVRELARFLDHAHHFPGPDGRPLGLLHRDIKPHNIQVTPDGGVRLLDFGVARASFDGRETHSTFGELTGTPGFIAPERRAGIEIPAGDVYSLGVVLWSLLTREFPKESPTEADLRDRAKRLSRGDDALAAALGLAIDMRHRSPEHRPTPRDVERRARELARTLEGPWIRDWASTLPSRRVETDDPLVGRTLAPEVATAPAPTPTPSRRPSWLVAGLVILVVLLAGFSASLLVALLVLLVTT